jgi:hypothetical protein
MNLQRIAMDALTTKNLQAVLSAKPAKAAPAPSSNPTENAAPAQRPTK